MHPEYGVLMAPHLNAQIHQHFFQVRLDMTCDDDNGGQGLVVSEVRSVTHAAPLHHAASRAACRGIAGA